jgi:tetratricopeptide (TPR) repeat protein
MEIVEQLKEDRAGLLLLMKGLIESGQHERCLRIAESMLYEDQNDIGGLFYTASSLNGMGHPEAAYSIMRQATLIRPDREEVWQNMGHIADKLWRFDEAMFCYGQAHIRNPNNPENLASLASAYVGVGNPALAKIYAERALEVDPDNQVAMVNKGFAHLAMCEFKEGWEGYDEVLGHKSQRRKATAYTVPPKFWDGKTQENVVIYGEQGLGDEIMFASMVEDATKTAKHVILDCDKKLEGLFKRSFPECSVYGTRMEEAPFWMSQEDIDSSLSIGSLGKHFRNDVKDFPGKAFLTADQDRRRMYRALLDGLGDGLKVGISWTGGNTLGGLRKLEIDVLADIVKSFPQITWVSLQYKDTPDYGLPIHNFPFATQTDDYDDTAALVAELDLVISVPQAVVHLAGALGKECLCMTPDNPRWIYWSAGNNHNWYKSVTLLRDWDTMGEQIKTALEHKLSEALYAQP